MNRIAFRLLVAACVLMLHAGGVFLFMKLWFYAALLGVGALGCLAGAVNFKKAVNVSQYTEEKHE